MIKVGITKEYKIPNDFRTPFTPKQSKIIDDSSNFRLVCQRSEIRCYKDDEYLENKISLVDKLDDCDVIGGDSNFLIYIGFSFNLSNLTYNLQ